MSMSKTVALSLAAILASAVSVQAATPSKKTSMHHSMSSKHSTATSKKMPMNSPEQTTESLNAQSLSRAQANQ